MEFSNSITRLFGIRYPIIQAGMVWNSGWRLASAVSNSGGLGLIGGGSMYPDVFREQIRKALAATHHPLGGEYSAHLSGYRKAYRYCDSGKSSRRFYFCR